MIKLGAYAVEFYPNTGIHIVNHGGTLIFRGKCNIGSGSTLWIGKSGTIDIGNNVSCWAQFKLISNIKISIGEDTRFGWDVMIMDNDFHKLTKVDGSGYSKGYAPVTIGKNCWFGNGSLVMKRSYLPDYTIVQARTIINRKFDIPPYSILGSNSEVIVKATGLWRNISDDVIEYPNI
ncbi:MAG: hypothetical protein LIP09_11010 [Bacteroidales bacterium]|nr:hypothetical protein [Bacteroidales bacterium]